MRSFSLVSICGLLLAASACGSSSGEPGDPGGAEIRSQADVQRLFEAIVPDLIEAFTALADELTPSALPSSTDKSNHISSIPCPGGGTLDMDLVTGQAMLIGCAAGGVTISATLALTVFDLGSSMYDANFNGSLTVSGSFNGTVTVNHAFISWTAPATVDNTFWEVTVTANGQTLVASSAGDGGGNSEDCSQCVGVNAGGPGQPSNRATECPSPSMGFSCLCETESGQPILFSLDPAGCIF